MVYLDIGFSISCRQTKEVSIFLCFPLGYGAMTLLSKVAHYVEITHGMSEYVGTKLPSSCCEGIRQQLENRENIWLDILRKTIFSQPDHPYARMFQLAGCNYQELVSAVKTNGLEATLSDLHRQGVYLTHDEFKGKTSIVRSGQHISSGPRSFANPFVSGWLEGNSGGSRSAGTKTCTGTSHLMYLTRYAALNVREFGLDRRIYVVVRPTLPSIAGLLFCLLYTRVGCKVHPWFAFGGMVANSTHYRLLTNYIGAVARWHGVSFPFPRHLPANDFSAVAAWIAMKRRHGVLCTLQAVASTGVRVASAALEKGWDISGTLFMSGGEALTDAKRQVIESAGIQVFPAYWTSEIGQIGHSCRQMNTGNCVHLFRDSVAVITHRRRARFSENEVNSLLFTTLLPQAPNIFINVEMEDAGVIDNVQCDCVYSAMGFTQQIRDIVSFGKLTGNGMTLFGTDIVRILEQALPARFGGSPADYQLVEQEGQEQTEIVLRVSPRVGQSVTQNIRDYFLLQLRKCQGGALASRVWDYSDALQVVIDEPLMTTAGKVLPLHLLKSRRTQTKVLTTS